MALSLLSGLLWIAPTATNVRSPCPGLNTLANHGYLPRSGKNISVPSLVPGRARHQYFAEQHFLGENLRFNETVFFTLTNANPGVDYYNATSTGQFMKARLADSLARNPNITNTRKERALQMRESSLYLSIMGDASIGVTPKKEAFVHIFFCEERLPIAKGWT
ncbi:Chloroperoxidase [Mycena albidolilacea]|uniref:Chloroperoxidase n=1 Tax=Mycena albidolilacea TaxID=1033008 RepID=A0AAD7A7Z5_9AGAR|nr:Chloroperoxidase [Mycena albidolilacea]